MRGSAWHTVAGISRFVLRKNRPQERQVLTPMLVAHVTCHVSPVVGTMMMGAPHTSGVCVWASTYAHSTLSTTKPCIPQAKSLTHV